MIDSIETGRKADGENSIADKIIRGLHDLEKMVDVNQGRWAWELLQNAKDSVADGNRKVLVEIELSEDCIVFRHNGIPFTEEDVRGLINQISYKEVNEGKEHKRNGKFGTGFLTTHLLSKIVQIRGIIKTVDEDFFRFSFPLDRNTTKAPELVNKIKDTWTAFQESTEGNKIDSYDEDDFNTSFTYNLQTKKQQDIARIGVNEFSKLIPFVLAFIPTIESVKIIDNINHSEIKFENNDEFEDEILLSINKIENGKKIKIKLLFAKDDDVAIASIIEPTETGYKIQDLKDFPKLFCDFPLIGTENFHFPVIVNSFYFNPFTERNGIWLKGDDDEVEENRKLLKKAVALYKQLLAKITELNFFDYYNICLSKIPNTNKDYFDKEWYENNIQKLIRKIITESKVVETEAGKKVLFSTVYFPDPGLKKEEREWIWYFSSNLQINTLPAKRHIDKWADLIWEECRKVDINNLVADLKSKANVSELIETLKYDEKGTIIWLNCCINFIYTLGGQNQFNNNELIPNQELNPKGVFKKRRELSLDEIKDDELKKIASLLGYNYYGKLIREDIKFEDTCDTITKRRVADKITELIEGKDKNQSLSPDEILAIRMLTEWFEKNPDQGKNLFSKLYNRKEKLLVDTITDKASLYRVLVSKTPLSTLAKVAEAIEDDPEILNIIIEFQKEKAEEKERNEMGEKVEMILAEALEQYGFEVRKYVFGKDLVITLKKNNIQYSIEVKSTSRESYVSMTPTQAKKAVSNSNIYALCVVHKNGSVVNNDFIKENAKFVIDIGDKLHNKFEEVLDFETNKEEIANTNEDIDLFYKNHLEYRYKISSNIWTKGANFFDFINYINNIVNKKGDN